MNKILYDDIFIWSNDYIMCHRFKHKIKINKKNEIKLIFQKIKNYIIKSKYNGYILVINKNMFSHNDILKFLKNIINENQFQILQLSIHPEHKNKKFNKNYSMGSFIINLKNILIKDYDFFSEDSKVNKIYSSKNMIFMDPNKYKQYYYLRISKIIKKYKIFDHEFFYKNNFLKEGTFFNHLVENTNPFYFLDQIIVSKSLRKFKKRIMDKYNLNEYYSNTKPCLFFGLYNLDDINKLEKHIGKRYILWGGTDADKTNFNHNMLIRIIKNIKIETHFSISKNLYSRLNDLGFNPINININLVDKKIFKPITKYGNKIYIYNGNCYGREYVYGKEIYEEVMRRLPEFDFILSNEINKEYYEMPDVYSQCFIGLRLTKNDGNANTVQEMNSMNIPIIHNGDENNSLSWETVDDVELQIRYRNIELFNKSIEKYKNILFVCSDYPGYGGAATNTFKLYKYYSSLGKNVNCIFYSNDKNDLFDNQSNIFLIKKSELYGKLLDFNPDLVILRNYIDDLTILKHFKCPIYFLIPGIFEPHLDKYYNEIETKDEMDKYIHNNILDTIRYCSKSFCASGHTKNILMDFYNLDVNILYFNYINYTNFFIKKDEKFESRQYEYGVIVSNFDRKVKNIDNIINKLKLTNKKTILIGKNSYKYGNNKIRTIGLINNRFLDKYYKKIKYIVQDSFYESCSNVYVEARYNGCKNINLDDIKIDQKINNKNNNEKYNLMIINNKKRYDIKLFSDLLQYKSIIKLNDNQSIKVINEYINNLLEERNLRINIKKRKYKSIFKILYFINIDYFIRKMSRVRFHSILKLFEYNNIILYLTGPGWYNYNDSIPMENNIDNMNIDFDFVILYKPLDKCNNINKKTFKKLNFLKCIRYNEMWDERWTKKEINDSNSDLIICHHYNDYLKYKKIYKHDIKRKFIYNPHHANPEIFYDFGKEREYDILLAGKSTIKHYPLRFRLFNLISKHKNGILKKYKIYEHDHPGYNNDLSFKDIALIDYAKNINKCYLCIGGTSKYNYRLGKYVEISMCGSLILGDLPYEDKKRLKKFVIIVDNQMSDNEILNIICKTLDDKKEMKRKMLLAKQWAQNFTTEKYCKILVDSMKEYKNYYNNYII